MTDEEDFTPVTAWELMLRTVSGLLRVFDRELEEELDLPLTWYDVIQNLAVTPNKRMRMQTLSDTLVLTRSGATRLIDRIEKAGLVRREPAAEDRRGYYAILTEEGQRVVKKAQRIHGAGIDSQFTQYLNEDELRRLHRIVGKVWNGNPGLAGKRSQV